MTALDLTGGQPMGRVPRCPEGEGHADEWFRADRACWGSDRNVNLSAGPTGADTVGSEQPFAVSLDQQVGAPEPRVLISADEITGQALTLHEAGRFAHEILALVDRGRAQGLDAGLNDRTAWTATGETDGR